MQIIYYSTNDFLNQMEKLQDEYNNITYFYKFLGTKEDFNSQKNFLKGFKLVAFYGFITKRIIKIVIRDNTGNKLLIQYKFTNSNIYYNRMINFLRQLEQVKK